mmetsp:Transcript_45565/g.102892  ORF Transcript_45565/g.102892 Transcript_45565/m.102892 type:complete len:260 (-) Transcript_45565:390-1169(-)|eukprot:CAMPEP_0172605990 /NCGR_PEP_ID=MMETSP1068-20121228/26178_1 /TAXON_ID=35684 /ORGANISM="Pseudopedinella elastica, Strain CCMP716" /LENGTH=259 /DNA_ID=CAMNT_0013408551 /DNA_START=26 /DNA_END=805 /DNA_ORIENTATION=-
MAGRQLTPTELYIVLLFLLNACGATRKEFEQEPECTKALGPSAARPTKFMPVAADLQDISGCDICERAIFEVHDIAESLRAGSGHNSIDELGVHAVLERLCDPRHKYGRWLSSLDIIESADALTAKEETVVLGSWRRDFLSSDLQSPGGSTGLESPQRFLLIREFFDPGHCQEECATCRASCAALLEEELDLDQLAAAVWRENELGAEALASEACARWTDRCSRPRRPMAQEKRQDFMWRPKTAKEVVSEDISVHMEGF